jgi:hypothetical protein
MKYLLSILSVAFIGCSTAYTVEMTYGTRPDGAGFRCIKRRPIFLYDENLAYCNTSKECEEVCNKAR